MILEYLQSILGTFEAHPYVFIFVGLLFAGEAVLLPAIYFALDGKLHLSYVLAVAMASTLLADMFWYYIGAHMNERFARKLVAGRVQKALEKLSGVFTKRSGKVLYFSKFVYGTRTAAQVLAGLELMPLRKYLSINFLGLFSLFMFIVALAYTIGFTIESLSGFVHSLEIAFLIFVVVLVCAHFAFGAYFKKKWSQ